MAVLLPGYSGVIWNAARASLVYANSNLNTSTPSSTKALARAVAATLKNACSAINVGILYSGLQQVYAVLAEIVPLPLGLSGTDQSFMLNRVNAIQAASLSAQSLLVSPRLVATQLSNGNPAVPDPQYLEWLVAFGFETPPTGLTSANLQSQAQAAANAWTDVANALRTTSVSYSGVSYNMVQLMATVSQVVATEISNASLISSTMTASQLWNQFVAMPVITRVVSEIMNDPTSATAQQTSAIRYVILSALNQFNQLIVSLRQVVTSQLKLGTVRQGDSPMTFAARELGDYTAWRQIVQVNGLLPPYFSPNPGPNVASPGQQLFLPPPNSTAPITPQTGPVASYVTNYLGVDTFLGPLNQPMLPWAGDYQIISGYDNLAISLGRRLQTTVGSLIYHEVFGSRVPPELGNIASSNELALIQEYTKSALASDPRVNKVLSCTAQTLGNYSVQVTAVVLPNGLGQEEVTVNEVLGPQ